MRDLALRLASIVRRPGVRRGVGALLFLAAAVFFGMAAAPHWSSVAALAANDAALPVLIAAVGLYAVTIALSGLSWEISLRAVGDAIPTTTAVLIILVAQFTKYIPGNVAYHVGRFALTVAAGCKGARVIAAMAVELGVGVALATGIAALTFALAGPALLAGAPLHPAPWTMALIVGGAVGMPVAIVLGLRRFTSRRFGADSLVALPGPRALSACVAVCAINFLLFGFILHMLAAKLYGAGGVGPLLLAGIFAAAWVIGLVTPGAPAGIGVREAVLLGALTPLYGEAAAVGLALVLRLVTTAGDGVMCLLGLALRQFLNVPVRIRAG